MASELGRTEFKLEIILANIVKNGLYAVIIIWKREHVDGFPDVLNS